MFPIWTLAKPENLVVGDRFNLAKSTAYDIMKEITNVLVNLLSNYVRWPKNVRISLNGKLLRARIHTHTHTHTHIHTQLSFNIYIKLSLKLSQYVRGAFVIFQI